MSWLVAIAIGVSPIVLGEIVIKLLPIVLPKWFVKHKDHAEQQAEMRVKIRADLRVDHPDSPCAHRGPFSEVDHTWSSLIDDRFPAAIWFKYRCRGCGNKTQWFGPTS